MPSTKTTPAIKEHKRLTMPASVQADPDGKQLWQWATANYTYQAADRLALTMLCHAWAEYCRQYKAHREGAVSKASTPMTAWYDRVTKMMFCLGMMPSQRSADGSAAPSGIGALETRGPDGGMPDMAEEGEGSE